MRTTDLINYDEKIIDKNEKKIFIVSGVLGLIILIILLFFSFFSLINYKIVLGYVLGFLTANALFYRIIRTVKKTNYIDFKKMTKKMHITNLVIYALVLVASCLLAYIWGVVACVGGIIVLRIAIIACSLRKEKS